MSDIPDLPPVLERLLQPGFHAQIGAYALESLPAEERIAFEAHLRECAECQLELPTLLDAALTLRRAMVPEAVSATTTAGPDPVNWINTKRAQIVEEMAGGAGVDAVEDAVDELLAAERLDELVDQDRASGAIAGAVNEDVAPERSMAEEPSGRSDSRPDEPPTTPEPLRSEIFVDLPDADALPEAGAVATGYPQAPQPADGRQARRSRARGRIAPGAQPTAAELATASPPKPSKLPWILGGLGLLFGIGSLIAALALAETKSNLEEEIAFQNTQIDELNAQRDAYLAQTTAVTWELQPTTLGTPGSGGAIFADPAGTSAFISVYGMPALGADQSYQVWYVRPDDTSAPGPVLTMDANGATIALLAPDLSAYKAIAVTVEPAAGSELPSTNPVLQAFLTT